MDNEFYRYIKELHTFVDYQAKKLKKMEKSFAELQQEVAQLKERTPLQVGNIEYKFDQLKVETLEGTLNIGLNPSDLEDTSEFSVDNKNIQVPPSPKVLFRATMDIEQEVRRYLETDLPDIYQAATDNLNMEADESYYQFIKEDILKQLPTRIQTHLNQLPQQERESEVNVAPKVIPKLKEEIKQGVYLFLEQLQKQTKGEKE